MIAPPGPAKQGFVVAKVKETMAGRRSPPVRSDRGGGGVKTPRRAGFPGKIGPRMAAEPGPRRAQAGRRDSTVVP